VPQFVRGLQDRNVVSHSQLVTPFGSPKSKGGSVSGRQGRPQIRGNQIPQDHSKEKKIKRSVSPVTKDMLPQ